MTLVIRQVEPTHEGELLEIARTVHFINLPPFADAIAKMVSASSDCFAQVLASPTPGEGDDRSARRYMFVLERESPDHEGKRVIGTSGITAGMGNARHPNLSYQLVRVRRRSEDLAKQDPDLHATGLDYVTGEVEHIVAQLYRDTASPTELGGLIVRKEYRGRRHGAPDLPGRPTPGRLLSFVRFHFIARYRAWFSDVMLAEMLAYLETYNDGNPFWRRFMRNFINLPYEKADRLSTRKREFMYRLLPDRVYMSLMPDDVVWNLGRVDRETERARRLLQEVGFRYTHRIDPFDAGPHLEAWTSEVSLVRDTMRDTVVRTAPRAELSHGAPAILSRDGSLERFLAAAGSVVQEDGGVVVDAESADALGVSVGDTIWRTPLAPVPEEHEDYDMPLIDLPSLDDEAYDHKLSDAYKAHTVGAPGRGPGPSS
ncbi:MAG: hypothetical protein Tsb0013_03670 [Phycisphaerales bacterium]